MSEWKRTEVVKTYEEDLCLSRKAIWEKLREKGWINSTQTPDSESLFKIMIAVAEQESLEKSGGRAR
jgi:phage portal protein BeeE